MRLGSGFLVLVLASGTAVGLAEGRSKFIPAQGAAKEGGRTVLDGVYTPEQADRGKGLYTQSCAGCHSADLRGNGTAPSLVEGDFAFQWADASVGELFEQIRKLMPSDRPNSLPPQSYADIVAYILQSNQFPTGMMELPPDAAALMQIRIVGKKG
jgi:mono/diheme cytochrome c family protein